MHIIAGFQDVLAFVKMKCFPCNMIHLGFVNCFKISLFYSCDPIILFDPEKLKSHLGYKMSSFCFN